MSNLYYIKTLVTKKISCNFGVLFLSWGFKQDFFLRSNNFHKSNPVVQLLLFLNLDKFTDTLSWIVSCFILFYKKLEVSLAPFKAVLILMPELITFTGLIMLLFIHVWCWFVEPHQHNVTKLSTAVQQITLHCAIFVSTAIVLQTPFLLNPYSFWEIPVWEKVFYFNMQTQLFKLGFVYIAMFICTFSKIIKAPKEGDFYASELALLVYTVLISSFVALSYYHLVLMLMVSWGLFTIFLVIIIEVENRTEPLDAWIGLYITALNMSWLFHGGYHYFDLLSSFFH